MFSTNWNMGWTGGWTDHTIRRSCYLPSECYRKVSVQDHSRQPEQIPVPCHRQEEASNCLLERTPLLLSSTASNRRPHWLWAQRQQRTEVKSVIQKEFEAWRLLYSKVTRDLHSPAARVLFDYVNKIQQTVT